MTKIAVVIPALEANDYSPLGDLEKFGDTTILEWKIEHLEEVVGLENIFVSTNSKKIVALAKRLGVQAITRAAKPADATSIFTHWDAIPHKDVMIANVTAPFISPKSYKAMIAAYTKMPKKYDSLVSVSNMKEYFLYDGKALNFDIKYHQPRKSIKPVQRLTNGCFIAKKDVFLKYKKFFGLSPLGYELKGLSTVEIKDMQDYAVSLDLISHYMREQLNEKRI